MSDKVNETKSKEGERIKTLEAWCAPAEAAARHTHTHTEVWKEFGAKQVWLSLVVQAMCC